MMEYIPGRGQTDGTISNVLVLFKLKKRKNGIPAACAKRVHHARNATQL